jgi:hypothetical protein
MDLENIWRQNSGRDDALNKLLDNGNYNNLQSRLPLKKLKSNLLIGIIWALLITVGYIAMYFFFRIWQVYIALGVLIVFNTIIMLKSWRLYQKTPSTVSPSNSLKEELTMHYNSFQRWWLLQQKMGLFVYPIAAAGGFVLGGTLGSGKPVEAFLYNAKMLSILGITILVLVPLCYFGARWMFNYAYGKHLKKLKSAIDDLS